MLETTRLRIRRFTLEDAPFVLELLNEPSFLRWIGDRRVRNHQDAHDYLTAGPLASYERFGFGLFAVEVKGPPKQTDPGGASEVAGMCGLLKRDNLDDVDLGFAFLPRFWSYGFAVEAAAAVLEYGHRELALERIVAITLPDNTSSIRVLENIGMTKERRVRLSADGEDLELFARDFV